MQNNQKYTGFEIAIVGVACRVPGAHNWKEYWDNLTNGIESIHVLSNQELFELGVDETTLNNKNFVKVGAKLPGKEFFDSAFFNYRPEDARLMNPAHRTFHECAWEALEDAGYDPERVNGLIGLYAGAGEDLNWRVYSMLKNNEQAIDDFTLSQINNKDYLASLLSYKLNLKGPSLSINTTCSTSLVAIHLACKSLLMGEAQMALAGGVSVITQKQKGYFYKEGMVNSSDGHCRAFDKNASGSVGAEGAGVVVLKKLQNAIADGDQIYAIIKGSAINNDGNRKVGFTAPSVDGQATCIRLAQRFSKIEPESISYIEAHGTGTKLGDPIEIEALNIAFQKSKKQNCAIGSVKTNIGHLDAAAGVAGLIKTALSLKYKKIPASLNYKESNPEIDFKSGPFHVNTELKEWTNEGDIPLRAGVSSFGIGGTNAHVILEEAPRQEKGDAGRDYKILTVSAKTETSLSRYMDDLKTYLHKTPDINVSDMSYTLQVGRKHFEYRRSVVYKNREELISLLDSEKLQKQKVKEKNKQVVFMFPGQGSQYMNMGKNLYETEKVFKEEMDKGFSILENLTDENFKTIIFPGNKHSDQINETRYTQPIVFLLEYSLARLMMSFGILPEYMIGHSIGEYVAACISGVFSYEEALKLVVKRGELMNNLPPGAMLSVAIKEEEANVYLKEGISLAAVNGPEQVVYSGDVKLINELMERLHELKIAHVKLHTSHAFHSCTQDGILDAFRKELEKVTFNKLQYPFISNLTGEFIKQEEAMSADYWVHHLRETVRFSDGIKTLLSQNNEFLFVEVGAGQSLAKLLKQQQQSKRGTTSISLIRHPKESGDDLGYLTEGISQLWRHGVNIDWMFYYKAEKRKRISLPTYSFDRIKYPTEVDPFEHGMSVNTHSINPNKNQELKNWIYYPVWKSSALSFTEKSIQRKGYLIFSFSDTFTDSLKTFLLRKEDDQVEIIIGESYKRESKNRYIIDPSETAHYIKLFRELNNDQLVITDIIHCWSIGVNPSEIDLSETGKEINKVFYSLVNIVKNLLQTQTLSNKRICLVTDCLHHVVGNEELTRAPSLLLGLMNVLPQEYSVSCINVDINLKESDNTLYEKLAEEIKNDHHDRIVAIRNGKRWLQDYQNNSLPLLKEKSALKKEKIYLITGGLGNVGFILAKYLLEQYQAKVILMGRKKSTEENGPEEWVDKLKQLKSISNNVFYYSTDVSKISEFKDCVDEIEKTIGPVQGIIHAAGIIDKTYFELVENISVKTTLEMFSPKITGIENIYTIFKNKSLDFVWVTSSLASLLGGLGYGAYSSANLYMDHFISSRSKELPHWKSIQLSEMLFSKERIRQEKDISRIGLKPEEIAELFDWSLTVRDHSVIAETVENLFYRIKRAYVQDKEVFLDNDEYFETTEKIERPGLQNSFVGPETETEKTIVKMLEDFFWIKGIGVEDNFFELGGDSLKAMVLLKRIEKVFKVKLYLSDFFKSVNVRQLSEDIDEKLWINKNSEQECVSII
jgi:phthiocerol/phenolphthiocerol synthesis type-I polyketide synthase E